MPGTHYPLEVQPVLPAAFAGLQTLAANLMFSWDRRVRGLFYRIDPQLWAATRHNPKIFLRRVSQQRLEALARDHAFLQEFDEVMRQYEAARRATDPNASAPPGIERGVDLVAYFCMEFGLHESLRLYSGGLGVLAGDHCKTANDMCLPMVAVGLMYRQGYFDQSIAADGSQQTRFQPVDLRDMPVTPVTDEEGRELRVHLETVAPPLHLRAWQVDVGHIRLYLLDTDVPENSAAARTITYQLYSGDRENRIAQEIVLGIGGVCLLRRLGLEPTAWHVNEGHPAFLILERCREAVRAGMDFDSALELVAASTVFTTHTPVPAGHDLFPRTLVAARLRPLVEALGISVERLLALGHSPQNGESFNMTALALRGARHVNAVSCIHRRVAAEMESYAWPEIEPEDSPIRAVTNGVHVPTFLAREWVNLFDSRRAEWRDHLGDREFWSEFVNAIPDHRFWSLRQSLKTEMMAHVRAKLEEQFARNRQGRGAVEAMRSALSPTNTRVLVLGFARRFATYKRPMLLFHDPDRLARLLGDARQPILVLFAGKAHPQDLPGQDMIRRINAFAASAEFAGRLYFIEDYDMALARKLVTGTDVWLNTPEYPLEASGTSGQKAAINGVLNLSVLDGWWAEGHDGSNGWAITPRDDVPVHELRDAMEAEELLDLLEREIVPCYFDHAEAGFSEAWVRMSKRAMASVLPRFSSHRMVSGYLQELYLPAMSAGRRLAIGNGAAARELAHWKSLVRRSWSNVDMRWEQPPPREVHCGQPVTLCVTVDLGGLAPGDVRLECVVESADGGMESMSLPFGAMPGDDTQATRFQLQFIPPDRGLLQFRVQLYPWHTLLCHPFEMGLRRWL